MNSAYLGKLLEKAKTTLRITSDRFNEEITDIIYAGIDNMKTRGVLVNEELRPMELRALLTYVRLNFGEPDNPERLKMSYDEQLAQLMTTSNYTDFGEYK